MLRTDVFRHFDVTLSASVVGGSARAEGTSTRPSRGVVKRPLRHLDLSSTIVRFWDRVDRGKRIYLVTTAEYCFSPGTRSLQYTGLGIKHL